MSGYAEFYMAEPLVTDGVYHCRKDTNLGYKHPSLVEYNALLSRSRLLAADPASIYSLEAEAATSAQILPQWEKWLDYVQSKEAIELEIVRLAAIEAESNAKALIATQRRSLQRQTEFDETDFDEIEEDFTEEVF